MQFAEYKQDSVDLINVIEVERIFFYCTLVYAYQNACIVSSLESQKGALTIQRCSVKNQKGAIVIDIICTAIAPFWFSTEHLEILIAPFWLSTDGINFVC